MAVAIPTSIRVDIFTDCARQSDSDDARPKLIGIYDMTDEGSNGVDTVGHGSHVCGIVAGNQIADALNGMTVSLSRNVSGWHRMQTSSCTKRAR